MSKAAGTANPTTVIVSFTKQIDPTSISGGFGLSGGVTVSGAVLAASDARKVILTTSALARNTVSTVTVNNVKDIDGVLVAPGSTVNFTSWRLAPGWVPKEIYYFNGAQNTSRDDFKALPKYPNSPDAVQWVKAFAMNQAPLADNYGARLTARFNPAATGVHTFYVTDDDDAELLLSSNTTEAGLQSLQVFPRAAPPFDAASSVACRCRGRGAAGKLEQPEWRGV